MKFTHVRNATHVIDYAGSRFLIDPMLSPKNAVAGFKGTLNDEIANPHVDLTVPVERIVDVDAGILTHPHDDHWDQAAANAIRDDMPIIVQDETDAERIREEGFTDVRVVEETLEFNGVTITRTGAVHGVPGVLDAFPPGSLRVMGVLLTHPTEQSVYMAGDTIWCDEVSEALTTHTPDVVVLSCGNAQVFGLGRMIMDASDALETAKAAPDATLVGVHMEAINHCVLTRAGLRAFAEQHGFMDRLLIPADGETVEFHAVQRV